MNIFVLSKCPTIAARFHCDKHVVKMILESAQMLATAHHECGVPSDVTYKPTHVNHPCTVWARTSSANYEWLFKLYDQLCTEYTTRYGRTHKTATLRHELINIPYGVPDGPLTPFAQAMPDEYKDPNPVTAYRQFYLAEKSSMLQWKGRPAPEWAQIKTVAQD
jgi:hypothetical protein